MPALGVTANICCLNQLFIKHNETWLLLILLLGNEYFPATDKINNKL